MNKKKKLDELGRLDVATYKKVEKHPIVVILDNIRSLNNIGSVFRTADALNVTSVYLCGITAQPPHRDIQKTALGATDSVDWTYVKKTTDAVSQLNEKGYTIVSVEQTENSIDLQDWDPPKDQKIALVFGNEVKGVDQDVINQSDYCLEIPQFGTKHSFNISVCAGIVLWEATLRMGLIKTNH